MLSLTQVRALSEVEFWSRAVTAARFKNHPDFVVEAQRSALREAINVARTRGFDDHQIVALVAEADLAETAALQAEAGVTRS